MKRKEVLAHREARGDEMTICDIAFYLKWASAVFTAFAAIFWFLASIVKTPTAIGPPIERNAGLIGGVLTEMAEGIARQSRWNARAAFAATLSALTQIALIYMPTCWG